MHSQWVRTLSPVVLVSRWDNNSERKPPLNPRFPNAVYSINTAKPTISTNKSCTVKGQRASMDSKM